MSESTLNLIADYPGDDFVIQGEVVSLTPQVSFRLDRAKRSYSHLENHYSEFTLSTKGMDLYELQKNWWLKLDDELKSHVPYCREHNLDLVLAHSLQFKVLFDSIYATYYAFENLISTKHPQSITYIHSIAQTNPSTSLYGLHEDRKRFFLPLLKYICQKKGIHLHVKSFKISKKNHSDQHRNSRQMRSFPLTFKSLKYYYKFKLPSSKDAPKNLNVLFLNFDQKHTDGMTRAVLAGKGKVYVRGNGTIYKLSPFGQDETVLLPQNIDRGRVHQDFELFFNNLQRNRFLLTDDFYSREVILQILEPFLREFILNRCPEVVCEIRIMKKFYQEHKIDFVIAHHWAQRQSTASLLARDGMNRVQSIGLQHGCTPVENPTRWLTEVQFFNHYFSTDMDSYTSAMNYAKASLNTHCRIHEYNDFLNPLVKLKNHYPDKRLFYVTNRCHVGMRRIRPYITTPATQLYNLQKGLLDAMAQKKDKQFVFKYVARHDWLNDSTLNYYRLKNYKNIALDTRPFPECLKDIDRVLLDYPGTTLYEAVAAGLPVLCLVDHRMKFEAHSLELFSKCIRTFASDDERNAHLDEFIEGPRESYIVKLPKAKRTASQTLASISSTDSKVLTGSVS